MYVSKKNQNKFALYARLSQDDGDKVESCSISNQRELIHAYVQAHPGITITNEYTDDGYTGTNFDRPGFKMMMEDIQKGKINGIIVKDLSRLGRNYIEMGKFLERIFPSLGVRFISINDNYDTAVEDSGIDSIVIPFKNLLNDSYCRDISAKIRSQMEVKKKRGDFVGSFAPYGYKKDPKNKNHLVIDDYAAGIVRRIFNYKLDGYNPAYIANALNEDGIPSPYEYKHMNHEKYRCAFVVSNESKWVPMAIYRILKNEFYIGTVVQGKSEKINYKIKAVRQIDKEDWIRVENVHEAIISKEQFERVQELLELDTCSNRDCNSVGIFSGLCICPDCGQVMYRRRVTVKGKHYTYMECSTRAKKDGCSRHAIREDKLAEAVLEMIQIKFSEINNLNQRLQMVKDMAKDDSHLNNIKAHISFLEEEKSKYLKLKENLYADFKNGIISEDEYQEFGNDFQLKLDKVEDTIKDANDTLFQVKNGGFKELYWVQHFLKYGRLEKLNRRILVELVDSIEIFDKNHIRINYRFEEEMKYFFDDGEVKQEEAVSCGA